MPDPGVASACGRNTGAERPDEAAWIADVERYLQLPPELRLEQPFPRALVRALLGLGWRTA
jgi:hypothetical protein